MKLKRYEIDYRISPTRRIFEALSEGLKNVERDIEESQNEGEFHFGVDDALEHAENLLGIAFVTAQTYITGTISDANKIAKSRNRFKKDQLLKDFSESLPRSTVTKMELCDAMANYFKHHDEWTDWSVAGLNQRTIAILRAVGIEQKQDHPCLKATELLLSSNSLDLMPLLSLILNWRKVVIAASKEGADNSCQ